MKVLMALTDGEEVIKCIPNHDRVRIKTYNTDCSMDFNYYYGGLYNTDRAVTP